MDLGKILIARKTRNYIGLEAVEIAMAKKLGGGGVTIVPFATGEDDEIVAMIQAAHAGTLDLQTDGGWAVGDSRTISIGSFTDGAGTTHAQQNIAIAISSFGDYNNCGCVMQFDFVENLATTIRLSDVASNAGGYGATEMYSTTLPALVNALPAWLKNSLVTFSVLSSAGSKSSTILTVTNNKLALRSESEVIGYASKSFSGEGEGLPYYYNMLSRMRNGWLRSPKKDSSESFLAWSGNRTEGIFPNNAKGVRPFGCL